MTTTTLLVPAAETAGTREMARQEFVRRYSRKFQYRFGPVQGLDTAVRHSLMLINIAADYYLFKEFYPDSTDAQNVLLYATAGTLSVLAIMLLFWRQMIYAWKRQLLDDDEEDVLAGNAGVQPYATGGKERRMLLVRNRPSSATANISNGGLTATGTDAAKGHNRRGSAPPEFNSYSSRNGNVFDSKGVENEGGEVCTDENCSDGVNNKATRPEDAMMNVLSKMKREENKFSMKPVTKLSAVAVAKTASIGHGTTSFASSSARNIGSGLGRLKSSHRLFGNKNDNSTNGDDDFVDIAAMEEGNARKNRNDDNSSTISDPAEEQTSRYSGSNNSHPSGLAPVTLVLLVALGDGVFKVGLLQRTFSDGVMVGSFAVFLLATLLSMYISLVEAYYGMLIFANLEWIVGDNIAKQDEEHDNDNDDGCKNRRRSRGVRSRTRDAVKWVSSPRQKRRQGFSNDESSRGKRGEADVRRKRSKVVDVSSGHKQHKNVKSNSRRAKKLEALGKRLSRSRSFDKKSKKDNELMSRSKSKDSTSRSAAHVSGRALRRLSALGQKREDDADEDGSDGIINEDEHQEFNHGNKHSRKKRSNK